MSVNCCVTSVPHHGSFEAFPKAVAAWQERLQAGLDRSIQASEQTMGHLEEAIHRDTLGDPATGVGAGSAKESRAGPAGVSGMWYQVKPGEPGAHEELPNAFWSHYDWAGTGVVSTLQELAFSSGPCAGVG